eukprot:990848-Ditylum_brightwellii.AAC.1
MASSWEKEDLWTDPDIDFDALYWACRSVNNFSEARGDPRSSKLSCTSNQQIPSGGSLCLWEGQYLHCSC